MYKITGGIPYASVAFASLNGAITGMSSAGITVHEGGWTSLLLHCCYIVVAGVGVGVGVGAVAVASAGAGAVAVV